MTTLNNLPDSPIAVDEGEILYIVSPTIGHSKSTLKRIVEYIKNKAIAAPVNTLPNWKAEETPPEIANGTKTAFVATTGAVRTVNMVVSMGDKTTYGKGRFSFSLPEPYDQPALWPSVGSAVATIGGKKFVGVCEIEADSTQITLSSAEGEWGLTLPSAWSKNDTLKLSISYMIEV